jgi:hypothetical protein
MYQSYFEDWEVKADFTKEFVSLWDGWLGDESYKLDLVTESEWRCRKTCTIYNKSQT